MSSQHFFLVFTSISDTRAFSTAQPESVGMSSKRLDKIRVQLQKSIKDGYFPGVVALIERKGKVVFFESYGKQDESKGRDMRKDSIFRIFSMTKPYTSVVAMMLWEEGKFFLKDPISKYLPEYKNQMYVGEIIKNPYNGKEELVRVNAWRPITIQDLLRHTSGFTYGIFGNTLVHKEYMKVKIQNYDATTEEMSKNLARLPLRYQPGTRWEYSRSTDVLGRLLEVVSGMPLDELMRKKLFEPLGMNDTGFVVAKNNWHRIAERRMNPKTGKPKGGFDVTKKMKAIYGGQTGLSTAGDYLKFCEMMLNGGQLNGGSYYQ